jgi:hypothetical protein
MKSQRQIRSTNYIKSLINNRKNGEKATTYLICIILYISNIYFFKY